MTGIRGKRVLVTGGAGFVGAPVCRRLHAAGAAQVIVPRRSDCDLTDAGAAAALFDAEAPDVVIHLAAEVGGIGANQANPGRFFYANMAMGLNVVEESRRRGVDKLVVAGTVCAYPKHSPVPFSEADLWDGYPEETNAPYGIAKKALLTMLQAYRDQYGLNGVYLLPVNLYGPRDNFDLDTSHVIPALIRKFETARRRGDDQVVCWGTGSASREFLYVEDCAEAVFLAAERYDGAEPVNVGAGQEVTIRELATVVARLVGCDAEVVWDASRPDGQPRRVLDTSRAERSFGFRASTALEDGLRRTIDWYRSEVSEVAATRA
ncbi:MAG: GDP-L-fucose synthase [Solirubrobacteraceae bacterium]|jgi:GDP-L-fucose synthase|nr:GDP-L-fucose synthase [Solirubrobacteraceae bacterium]